MNLKDDFFTIVEFTEIENGFVVSIELKGNHIIYSGHFPGYPVTPGVIQMQIVHELLEYKMGQKLNLISSPNCKFLKVLNPEETPVIIISISLTFEKDIIRVNAIGKKETDIFFKFISLYGIFHPNTSTK